MTQTEQANDAGHDASSLLLLLLLPLPTLCLVLFFSAWRFYSPQRAGAGAQWGQQKAGAGCMILNNVKHQCTWPVLSCAACMR